MNGREKLINAPGGGAFELLEAAAADARSGRLPQAEKSLREMLGREPGNVDAWYQLGLVSSGQRKWNDAIDAFQRVIEVRPRHADAQYRKGVALAELGRNAEAEASLADAIAAQPRFAAAFVALGRVQERLSRPEAAIASHRQAIDCAPEFVEAHFQLARMLHLSGRLNESVARYEEVIRRAPDYADAHNNLGLVLRRLGRGEAAIAAFRRAIAVKSDHHLAFCNLGNILWEQERPDEAAAAYRASIAAAPQYVFPYTNLSRMYRERHKLPEAATFARRAIEADPRNPAAHAELACVLHAQGMYDEARAALDRALALPSSDHELMLALAHACRMCGQLDAAVSLYRKACAHKPDYAIAHNNLGMVLQSMGDMAAAEKEYRAAIKAAPNLGAAHVNLAQLTRFREYNDQLREMESLLQEDSMPPIQRAAVMFAIAKAFDDIGDYDKSFEYLHPANRYKYGLLSREVEAGHFELNTKMREALSASFFDRSDSPGDPSTVPILIVGMPRSGTSLVEQILSSHSLVHGAGELPDLTRICGGWTKKVVAGSFPKRASELAADEVRRRGAEYVSVLRRQSADACCITEKEPFNFRFLGFFRLMLPNAKIIHCMRDPVDTCMSSYKRHFDSGMIFSYDLRSLGAYYNSYRDLMNHWRAVLPATMLEIQYEDLVADQEAKTRELLAYCGLPWEDRCLRFHENERAVRTPSFAQVRQPIYKTAVASSRKYYPYIGPLLETLGIDPEAPQS